MNHFPFEHTQEHARAWLESCRCDHAVSQQLPSYIPKRLLAISRTPAGSLCVTVISSSMPVRYATLSYKWSGTHEPRLTQARLKDCQGQNLWFDVEILPKTIADAVITTDALGIGHLWVDALCIIQDDEADKAEQVGTMSNIYRQAAITIIASRSDSANEGFLHYRHGRECHEDARSSHPSKWNFRLSYCIRQGEPGSIILTTIPDVPEEPLSRRAWSFQEMLLSHHIIDYGTMRTTFNCLQTNRDCTRSISYSDNGDTRIYNNFYALQRLRDIEDRA